MQEVDRTVHHMQDDAANYPDPADRATQEEEFSLELRTRDRERKLIKKIDNTIEAIVQDDYGFCETCGMKLEFVGLRPVLQPINVSIAKHSTKSKRNSWVANVRGVEHQSTTSPNLVPSSQTDSAFCTGRASSPRWIGDQ